MISIADELDFGVRALRAGAAGFASKSWSHEQLRQAIRDVGLRGGHVGPRLAQALASVVRPVDGAQRPHEQLSDRELDVLQRLANGESIKRIGHVLAVSPKTVSTYRRRLLGKLRLENNAQLVAYAIEVGLVPRR